MYIHIILIDIIVIVIIVVVIIIIVAVFNIIIITLCIYAYNHVAALAFDIHGCIEQLYTNRCFIIEGLFMICGITPLMYMSRNVKEIRYL